MIIRNRNQDKTHFLEISEEYYEFLIEIFFFWGDTVQKIGIIVQARMSSQRLPGKVLREVNGKPILQYIVERLAHCQSTQDVVVATSREKSDDHIEEFCINKNVPCFRGSLTDVASRFKEISENEQWNAFIRINGDSPLIDQHLIDMGVNHYLQGTYDLVTNVFPRSYPPGQSVEIVRADTFMKVYPRLTDKDDIEHVTRFFYQNPTEFEIFNFSSSIDYSHIHLSVDTPGDMQVFSKIIQKMVCPHWDYHLKEIITLYQEVSDKQVV